MDMMAGVLRIGDVSIDVRLRESHNISMTLTRYALESGKSLSDHLIENPNEVEIEFEMTNSDGGRERSKKAFSDFVRMMKQRLPVDIITEHATYHNMVFTGFPSEHAAPNLGTLRATARFEQMGVVGAKNTITAGRNERVLSGYPMYSGNVGYGTQPIEMRQNQDVTYRTGCEFIDSGIQSMRDSINNPAKIEKIISKLIDYGQGIF